MKNTTEKMPPVIIERPEMPQATWDALKAHITREKVKKKQALEQTQEFERLRREREQKKKEQALTLEETKSEIARLEQQLILHKEGKHMLFQKLKKVIHQEQGMKENDKSSFATQMYLQPPSRVSGMSIYQRSSAASGIVSLAENFRSPPRSGTLKRPSDPFMGESPFGPPTTEDPYKRQRPLLNEQENGKKMIGNDSLRRSNFHLREPNTEEFKLIQSREDHLRQSQAPSGRSTMAPPPSSNPITPSASPSTASTDVVMPHLDSKSGPRKTPAASPLTPSTETAPSEVHDADVNIQSEKSSKSAGPSPVSLEGNPNRMSADGEKNLQSIAPIQATLRPNPGQPWLGIDAQGICPRPIIPEVIRPTPSFASVPYPIHSRYGDGLPYGSAFVRPFNDAMRFSQPASDKIQPPQNLMATGPNVGAAFVRLGEPGNAERLHQASTSFLPPNSNSSSGLSKQSSDPASNDGPFYIPSHVDARIYSQHREQALVHYQQQAYAAAAMAHLPQHYRYDGALMQGYPTYLGIPLMGAHPIQMVDQALGRRTESYYEK